MSAETLGEKADRGALDTVDRAEGYNLVEALLLAAVGEEEDMLVGWQDGEVRIALPDGSRFSCETLIGAAEKAGEAVDGICVSGGRPEDVSRHCPRCEEFAAQLEWLRLHGVGVDDLAGKGQGEDMEPEYRFQREPQKAAQFYAALAAATGTETAPFDVEAILALIADYRAGYPEETWPDVTSQLPDAWQSWGERAAAQMARRTCDALTRRIREAQTISAHAARGE